MEDYLFSLGLYKKAIAKDGSSLFRAVSEQLYFTQVHSFKIRQHCVDFIERNEDFCGRLTDEDLESHLENIGNPQEYPEPYMLEVVSKLYKRNFIIYQEVGEPPHEPVGNEYKDSVVLASPDGLHYDTVYPKSYLSASALCQSIVYEILYKRVFKFGESVDMAVSKMLHDKAYSKQRRCHLLNQSFYECTRQAEEEEEESKPWDEDAETEIKKALAQGIPPFPYKVAKALDPLIYRNVEYDIWNEKRKEQMKNEQLVTPDVAPGVKCLVRVIEDEDPYIAHIQEVKEENGQVTVYVEELCEKYIVALDSIEVLPVPAYKVLWQNAKPHRYYPGGPKSPGQDKWKSRKKYLKKLNASSSACLMSPGSSPSNQSNEIAIPPPKPRNNSGKSHSYNGGARYNSQYRWKSNKQYDAGYCQNISQSLNENQTSPRNMNDITSSFAQMSCEEVSQAAYAQPWRRPNKIFQTAPISIPVRPIDNQYPPRGMEVQVPPMVKDVDWSGEASSMVGSPNGYSPVSFVLTSVYPCDSVNCVPPEYSPINCDTNPPTPLTPSPPQVHHPSQLPVLAMPSPTDETPMSSAPAQASGSPIALFPCPVYTGMVVMYGDGSVHPVSVTPWRQDYANVDNTQGLPGVYYNSLGTPPPNCISPPLAQWVPAPPQWSPTGPGFAPPHPGEIVYPTVYGTPPWSPQGGYVVPQTQMAYQMSPGQPQYFPIQHPVQTTGRKPSH